MYQNAIIPYNPCTYNNAYWNIALHLFSRLYDHMNFSVRLSLAYIYSHSPNHLTWNNTNLPWVLSLQKIKHRRGQCSKIVPSIFYSFDSVNWKWSQSFYLKHCFYNIVPGFYIFYAELKIFKQIKEILSLPYFHPWTIVYDFIIFFPLFWFHCLILFYKFIKVRPWFNLVNICASRPTFLCIHTSRTN